MICITMIEMAVQNPEQLTIMQYASNIPHMYIWDPFPLVNIVSTNEFTTAYCNRKCKPISHYGSIGLQDLNK